MNNPLQIAIPPAKVPELVAAAKKARKSVEAFVTGLVLDAIAPSYATIADVAKAAKVSPMTVSYALRDVGTVSAETRERVREVAGRLGYQPSSAAQALRKRRKTVSKGRPLGAKNGAKI